MNYCEQCGNKLDKNMKFCTKCGAKIKREADLTRIVLLVGVYVVLFSSFAFGIVSWNQMNELFRLIFFGFETLLFFILSLALKKISNRTSRVFFIIGLILVPFTLSRIPYYGLIGEYFVSGAGLYTYLAILYLVTFGMYLLVNIKFKSSLVNYLAIISLLVSFISFAFIFDKNITVIGLLMVCYILVINVLSKLSIFSETFRKSLSNFSLVFGLVILPYLGFTMAKVGEVDTFINLLTLILYTVDASFKLSSNKKGILQGFNPLTISILVYNFIVANLYVDYKSICMFALAISFILLFYISLLFDSKVYKNFSLVNSYLMLFLVSCIGIVNNEFNSLLILSIIAILYNLSILLILKNNVVHFMLPLNYILVVIAVANSFLKTSFLGSVNILIGLLIITYLVLKLIKNKFNMVYYVSALILSIISLIDLCIVGINIVSIITLILFLILFIISSLFKNPMGLVLVTYIILNFGLVCATNNFYYTLLVIGLVTIPLSFVFEKITKVNYKGFILYAEIIIFIISLFNNFNYPLYILALNVLAYVLGFISLIKYHNISFYRIIYIMLGFTLIYRFMALLISVPLISSLISFILILIIIVILYLLDKEKNGFLIIESLVLLIPYISTVNLYFSEYIELYIIPIIVYDIVITTALTYNSKETKRIMTLVPLLVVAYFFLTINYGVPSIIFDVLLFALFIILGLIRKHNLLIYFGIAFFILTMIFNLFTVVNSLAIVVILLALGFILIGVSLFAELRKKEQ